jgi:hypothetical protein
MKRFSGDTDSIHEQVIESELRALFSATGARVNDDVWLRVEARWTADNTPLVVEIFREDDNGGRETVATFDGTLARGVWEQQWTIALPKSRLDELHGAIHLRFEARPDGHPAPVLSQLMLVHRTRFSS